MTQTNQSHPPLTHQDVEESTKVLGSVLDRLPECPAADAARKHLEWSKQSAHRAVEGGPESEGSQYG